MKYFTICLLFIAQLSFAQSESLTNIIDRIEFEGDTIQAVFSWVTDNVKYDLKKLKKLKSGVNFYKEGNYKSTEEYRAAQLEQVIKKKRGVCEDYSLLFDALVKELGYESQIVGGITKRNGRVNKGAGHAWNAVKVKGEWKLFDPTWGAGHVKDNKKFVKKYFAQWYSADPDFMKETHLPFDPIWQLSPNPLSLQDFSKGTQTNAENPYDYDKIITAYLKMNEKERFADELTRIEVSDKNLLPIKRRKEYLKSKMSSGEVPAILDECRASSILFSEYFAKGKNKRFTDSKWTMEYSETVLVKIQNQSKQAILDFGNVKTKSRKKKSQLSKFIKQTKKTLKRVDEELEFLRSKR